MLYWLIACAPSFGNCWFLQLSPRSSHIGSLGPHTLSIQLILLLNPKIKCSNTWARRATSQFYSFDRLTIAKVLSVRENCIKTWPSQLSIISEYRCDILVYTYTMLSIAFNVQIKCTWDDETRLSGILTWKRMCSTKTHIDMINGIQTLCIPSDFLVWRLTVSNISQTEIHSTQIVHGVTSSICSVCADDPTSEGGWTKTNATRVACCHQYHSSGIPSPPHQQRPGFNLKLPTSPCRIPRIIVVSCVFKVFCCSVQSLCGHGEHQLTWRWRVSARRISFCVQHAQHKNLNLLHVVRPDNNWCHFTSSAPRSAIAEHIIYGIGVLSFLRCGLRDTVY